MPFPDKHEQKAIHYLNRAEAAERRVAELEEGLRDIQRDDEDDEGRVDYIAALLHQESLNP